eukprot:gene7806-9159_t
MSNEAMMLKVRLVDKKVFKKFQFYPKKTVKEARLFIAKELEVDADQYGLFLPPRDDQNGIWFRDDYPLDFYGLEGETDQKEALLFASKDSSLMEFVEFKKRYRPIKVAKGGDQYKTVMVDDTMNVADAILHILTHVPESCAISESELFSMSEDEVEVLSGDMTIREQGYVGECTTGLMKSAKGEINLYVKVPYFEGWIMRKRGGSIIKGLKNWNKRWYTLKKNKLIYHKAKGIGPEMGCILMKTVQAVRPARNVSEIPGKYAKSCFEVATPARTFVMLANNPNDMKRWVEILDFSRRMFAYETHFFGVAQRNGANRMSMVVGKNGLPQSNSEESDASESEDESVSAESARKREEEEREKEAAKKLAEEEASRKLAEEKQRQEDMERAAEIKRIEEEEAAVRKRIREEEEFLAKQQQLEQEKARQLAEQIEEEKRLEELMMQMEMEQDERIKLRDEQDRLDRERAEITRRLEEEQVKLREERERLDREREDAERAERERLAAEKEREEERARVQAELRRLEEEEAAAAEIALVEREEMERLAREEAERLEREEEEDMMEQFAKDQEEEEKRQIGSKRLQSMQARLESVGAEMPELAFLLSEASVSTPESLLVAWANYITAESKFNKSTSPQLCPVTANLELYINLLHKLDPQEFTLEALETKLSNVERAEMIVESLERYGITSIQAEQLLATDADSHHNVLLTIYEEVVGNWEEDFQTQIVSKRLFATKYITTILAKSNLLEAKLPSSPYEMLSSLMDGQLLCHLIEKIFPGTIDVGVVEKNSEKKGRANLYLAINASRAVGAKHTIGKEQIEHMRPADMHNVVWEIVEACLMQAADPAKNRSLFHLMRAETRNAFRALDRDKIMLRWVNHHLRRGTSGRQINNFSDDLEDCENYAYLFEQIAPKVSRKDEILAEQDWTRRASIVLAMAEQIGAMTLLTPRDIVETENSSLNLLFVADLMRVCPALPTYRMGVDEHLSDQVAKSSEQSNNDPQLIEWINAMALPGLTGPITNLLEDLQDGTVFLRILDRVAPAGTVDARKLRIAPTSVFKKIELCNYTMEVCHKLKFNVAGIAGTDLLNGNLRANRAILLQIRRFLGDKVTVDVATQHQAAALRWANNRVGVDCKVKHIQSFKDQFLQDGLFFLELLEALHPKTINRSVIRSGTTEEAMESNARHFLTCAWSVGTPLNVLWEDVVKVRSKCIKHIVETLQESDPHAPAPTVGSTPTSPYTAIAIDKPIRPENCIIIIDRNTTTHPSPTTNPFGSKPTSSNDTNIPTFSTGSNPFASAKQQTQPAPSVPISKPTFVFGNQTHHSRNTADSSITPTFKQNNPTSTLGKLDELKREVSKLEGELREKEELKGYQMIIEELQREAGESDSNRVVEIERLKQEKRMLVEQESKRQLAHAKLITTMRKDLEKLRAENFARELERLEEQEVQRLEQEKIQKKIDEDNERKRKIQEAKEQAEKQRRAKEARDTKIVATKPEIAPYSNQVQFIATIPRTRVTHI